MRRAVLLGAAIAAVAAALAGTARAGDVWAPKKIVATGDLMPDGGAADYITGWPVINDRGDIAFVVNTKKEKPKLEFGTLLCVRDAAGKLRVPLQKGTSLGGTDMLEGMAAIALSEDGFVGAKVSMAGKAMAGGAWGAMIGVGDAIVRADAAGKVTVVAKAGAAAPGTEGTFLTLPDSPAISKEGRIIFSAGIKEGGKGVGGGLWRMDADGSVKLLARKGMAIPSLKDETFGTMMTNNAMISSDGVTVLNSFLAGKDGGSETERWGVWRISSKGELQPMMYSWGAAPFGEDKAGKKGEPSQFKSAAVNSSGDIAVTLNVLKSSIRAGVLTLDGEEKVRVVATTETPADDGLRINSFENVVINDKGKVAFTSWVFGENVKGTNAIFAEGTDGKIRMIARGGTEAPGSGGATFKFLDAPQLCATGQVVFGATLEDNKRGLWMTDTAGNVQLIAMIGQKVPFSSGVTRVISDVSICSVSGISQSGGGDGRAKALTNDGTLVYYCRFEDKISAILTGKFVTGK